ncbi:MAG: acyltransferase [Fuerstiella sp.]
MTNRISKLQQLEGLRGTAAVVVLVSHLRRTFFLEEKAWVESELPYAVSVCIEAFFDGKFGVWLFWVMSALVLSLRYHATADVGQANGLMTSATIRRYPRLVLPSAASVLIAWILHANGWMTHVKLAALLGPEYHPWLASFYQFDPSLFTALKSGMYSCFFDYNPEAAYNPVLWSMEVELYGSFFLFGYLTLIGKHPARLLIYMATLAVVFQLKVHWLNSFVLGAMICDGFVNQERLKRWVPKFVTSSFLFVVHSRLIAWLLILPVLFLIGLPNFAGVLNLFLSAAVAAYVTVSQPAAGFFARRIPVFLGKISFGLYLIHLPLICSVAYPLYTTFSEYLPVQLASIVSALMIAALSILGGWVLWFLADRPAIVFSRAVADWLRGDLRKGSPQAIVGPGKLA